MIISRLIAICLLLVLALQSVSVRAAPAASTPWRVVSQHPAAPSFISPAGLAVDRDGNIYVADSRLNQVEKLAPWGARLAVFGSYGWRPGHFRGLRGIGVDQWGHIYVDDQQNHRIQKLSPTGQPLAAFELGGYSWPTGMAVDRWGNIYLSFYDHITRLSARGQILAIWHAHADAVAVDHAGNVHTLGPYTYDPASKRYYPTLDTYSPAGALISRAPYTLGNANAIAVDRSGFVYVLDEGHYPYYYINKLTSAGTLLAAWRIHPGPFYGPRAIAVDGSGNVLLADASQHRVTRLSRNGTVAAIWGTHGTAPGRFQLPAAVAADRQGNLYVADTWNNRIQELSPAGVPLRQWGSKGSLPGQLYEPTAVAVDRQGNVVVADYGNSRLEVYSPAGRYIRNVRVPGPHFVYSFQAYPSYYGASSLSLAIDSQGNYLIADASLHRVAKLSPTGAILAAYSEWVTARSSTPGGIAVDAQDNIYIADSGGSRIVKLSPAGHRLAVWGSFGYVRPGDFNLPFGIAVDAAGKVFVSDVGNHRIQELSPTGQPLRAWGTLGAAPGQFAFPEGVATGPGGAVYVADTWNNRVQTLKP